MEHVRVLCYYSKPYYKSYDETQNVPYKPHR